LKSVRICFFILLLIIAGCNTFMKPMQIDDPAFNKNALYGKKVLLIPLIHLDYEDNSSATQLFDKPSDPNEIKSNIQNDIYSACMSVPWDLLYWVDISAADLAALVTLTKEKSYWRVTGIDIEKLKMAPQGFDFILVPAAMTISKEASDSPSMQSSDSPARGMSAQFDYAILDGQSGRSLAYGRTEGLVARGGAFDNAIGRDPVKLAARDAIRQFIELMKKD